MTVGNATNANNSNNSAFLGGVAASGYALTSGYYSGLHVGNSDQLGGVAASSYFQNGGALTASSASIGGHTPWTNSTCYWATQGSSNSFAPGAYGTAKSYCSSNYVAISGACTAGLSPNTYLTSSYYDYAYNSWACQFYNNGTGNAIVASTALCCPN
jgi:hypothetical protein